MDDGLEGLISHSLPPRKHPAWRSIMIINLTFTGLALIAYSVFLAWIYNNLTISHGVADIYSGACSKTSRIAAYAQFSVSAFAVLLFSAGTYGVQLLLSPTRDEVDKAHLHESWLHVGTGGLRNTRWIHKRRLSTAIVLGAACVLLPFLHSSVLFTTSAATDRTLALVTESFLTETQLNETFIHSTFQAKADQYFNISKSARSPPGPKNYAALLKQMQNNPTKLIRLSPADCRSAYASPVLPSNYSNVLLITSFNGISSYGFIDGDLQYPEMPKSPDYESMRKAVDWPGMTGTVSLFHQPCENTEFDFGANNTWNIPVWDYYCTPISHPVEYCLAEPFTLGCGVSLNTRIFIGVLACLLAEFICLASLTFLHGFRPLATAGDAVASFLETPDPSTAKKSSLAIQSVHSPLSRFDEFGISRSQRDINKWKRKWPIWRSAVDTETCTIFINILFLGFFAIATIVLVIYNDGMLTLYQQLTLTSPTSSHGLLPNLLYLGCIHLGVSIAYLFYNHLWTRMFAAAELNAYIHTRSPLRTTTSHPTHRRTYYLNIKPHFSIAFLVALMFLHFLTSRAMRITSIDVYDITAVYSHRHISFSTSTSSAISALVMGFVLLCALAFAMEKKLDPGMPVLATCSMAISAACHASNSTATGALRYGRVASTGKLGFSGGQVSRP